MVRYIFPIGKTLTTNGLKLLFSVLFSFKLTASDQLDLYSSIKNIHPQNFAQKLERDDDFLQYCLQFKDKKNGSLIHTFVHELDVEHLEAFLPYCPHEYLKKKSNGKTPLALAEKLKEDEFGKKTRKLAEQCEDLIETQELNTDPTFFVNTWPDWIKSILLIK